MTAPATGSAPPDGSPPPAGTALVGATLADGTGAAPMPDAAIVVSGGRIGWVGPAVELERTPGTWRRVDLAGKYVTPGLMDANVHLVLHTDPHVLLRYAPGEYDELVLEAAQVALRAGITTVFDTWGPLEALRRVRDRINAGTAAGSRIFLAGNIIGNGGPWSPDFHPYGKALNPAVVDEVNRHWEQGVGADLTWMPAADVRRVVRDYIAASGVDFVKYASSAHGQPRLIALSPDAQRAIVEEAHAAGRTVQACTLTSEALTLAIDAGVDLLQHGSSTGRRPMPDALLARIVGRGLPCVVLLYTERYVAAGRTATGLSADWRDALDVRERNARRLIGAGGVLLHATDGGVFGPDVGRSPWLGPLFDLPDVPFHLGRSHVLWHQAMIERGMAPMDALVASTRDIARAYHLGDDLGTVERGKRADLLVLDADPLADPANYGRIARVMKDGAFVDRGRLPERPVLTRGHAVDPPVE